MYCGIKIFLGFLGPLKQGASLHLSFERLFNNRFSLCQIGFLCSRSQRRYGMPAVQKPSEEQEHDI
jgi:hypothetical protein